MALAGCRSDGGLGRKDSAHSWSWTTDTLAYRMHENVESTNRTISSVPAWLQDEWRQGWIDFGVTNDLFVGDTPDYTGR